MTIIEGPEGVKWELGFNCFLTGKMRFGSLGEKVIKVIKMGMGNTDSNTWTFSDFNR